MARSAQTAPAPDWNPRSPCRFDAPGRLNPGATVPGLTPPRPLQRAHLIDETHRLQTPAGGRPGGVRHPAPDRGPAGEDRVR